MIVFERVYKKYQDKTVIQNLSLEVQKGKTLVLLGTSGSGKTTALKMINRIIEPISGTIFIDGIDVMKTDPIKLRRRIGYAIQDIGLFPHMTVSENIGLALKLLRWESSKIFQRVSHLLKQVKLDPDVFGQKYPKELSGGQKQRVGVARALALDPPIILMDEPFGALDPIIREQMQNEFLELNESIQKTVIFVTHDIFEAFKIADQIALLNEGVLQQIGAPFELLQKPQNSFVQQYFSKHRFQFHLMAKSVKDLPFVKKAHFQESTLDASCNLMDALDGFYKAKSQELAVYEKDQFLGIISKKDILTTLMEEN